MGHCGRVGVAEPVMGCSGLLWQRCQGGGAGAGAPPPIWGELPPHVLSNHPSFFTKCHMGSGPSSSSIMRWLGLITGDRVQIRPSSGCWKGSLILSVEGGVAGTPLVNTACIPAGYSLAGSELRCCSLWGGGCPLPPLPSPLPFGPFPPACRMQPGHNAFVMERGRWGRERASCRAAAAHSDRGCPVGLN